MKFTYSWLKEHLETEATPLEISKKLTSLGLVIDQMHNPAEGLEDLVIAELKSVEQHPDADKLKVCQAIYSADGSKACQVVCGDPKVYQGMKVVMAKPGQLIPLNGMTIRETKVRGVTSAGMFCSAQELMLEEKSDGIINLPKSAPVGESYVNYAHLNDTVFDMEITPNRGDCLGIRGVARDLAAAGFGRLKPLQIPDITATEPATRTISISQESAAACSVFYLREIQGVKNGPSPKWLQDKLRAVGLRPRSILVDITNFMTYAYGRPMHVFDADKVHGNLVVRPARGGEKVSTLDDKTHEMSDWMHVVSDDAGPVGIAGIVGGTASGASNETRNVLLEAALFDASLIAKTGRKLGILSDARYRFERGVDANIIEDCMTIATQMILDLCGGTPKLMSKAGQEVNIEKTIGFDPKQVQYLGGLTVERVRILKILSSLGCVLEDTGAIVNVTIPSWRHDLSLEQDLVEEVCRIIGYEHIELAELPDMAHNNARDSSVDQVIEKRDVARRHLSGRGLLEVNTWSFLDQKRAALFEGQDASLTLKNPISQDLSIMRPELLANLIAAVGRNADRGYRSSSMFEIGSAYKSSGQNGQENRIAAVRSHEIQERHWLGGTKEVSVFDIKADVFSLLEAFGFDVTQFQLKSEGPSWYHPGRVGTLYLGPKMKIASFGEIHPLVTEALEVDERVVGFELTMDRLPIKPIHPQRKPLEISNLQPIHRDFAFIVPESAAADRVVSAARKADKSIICAHVFDVYQGKGVQDGFKSLALCVTFEQREKTLTDDEINALMDQVIIHVGRETGAELRS